MPFIRLLFITALLMIALPAHANWLNGSVWRRNVEDAQAFVGAGLEDLAENVKVIRNGKSAVLYTPSSGPPARVNDEDTSAPLRMAGTNGHTICFTSDTQSDEALSDPWSTNGNLTVEVFWFGSYGETNIENFILLATLTPTNPCVYDVPQGELLLRAETQANTFGLVSIRANR